MDLTLNDLFCGCGGMGLGFKQAGWKILGSWDWDKWAVKSYAHNVESHVQQADISQMIWSDLPRATAWSFGFPCQDLSVAGNQAGIQISCMESSCLKVFNIKDMKEDHTCPFCDSINLKAATRSGLFFEVMRLLAETRMNAPQNMPAFILAENVKGLRPYLGVLEEEYKAVGYTMSVQLYTSKYWGVPQSRERYYVVGIRNDLDLGFEHPIEQKDYIPPLSSVLEEIIPDKYYMPADKAARIIEQALLRVSELKGVHATLTPDRVEKRQNGPRARESEEPMFTLTAQDIHGIIEEIQTVYTDKDGCAYCCDANYAKGTSPGDVGSGRRTQIIEEAKDTVAIDYSRFRVRKLTPREYARLQGFPDDYELVCSDSQTYRQFGNAVTVPVARAIALTMRNALIK